MSRCLPLTVLTLALTAAALAATPQELIQATAPPPDALWLESLDLRLMSIGWEKPQAGKSVERNPLRLGGVTYPHGIGSHADSEFTLDLKGVATRFVAMVGVDDEKRGAGSVVFSVSVDGKRRYQSPVLKGGQPPQLVDVELTGAKRMTLRITDAGDGIDSDHGDWAGALLMLQPGATEKPVAILPAAASEPPLPIASGVAPAEPAIHGPRIVGTTPGRPFVWRVPATGDGPLVYGADKLPAGLVLDPNTGVISGALKEAGRTTVTLRVKGPRGSTSRPLVIVGGEHKLALTPPLGWNSWNVWAGAVTDQRVREAGDAMLASGLAAHGFQYVNIDDCWEAGRDANGEIQTNQRFPDMRALGDYLHARGLKLGIYSSPGPKTCGQYEGSYQHEAQDAKTYGKWGVDYLKYDWCSYGSVATGDGLEERQKPYRVMAEALDASGRDIVFAFCQYGMGKVWEWGASIGGNVWRTTGDINDSWGSLEQIGFSGSPRAAFAGPGHWNDPDMMVVGKVGWGRARPSHLTPNEQITHVTLWCLQAAPLLLGCDLTQLDRFTLDLLTNDEVLDIDQDPLGKAAKRVAQVDEGEVWARPLWDGTMAVGLFNRDYEPHEVTARWADLGLQGPQPVRDLWQRKDVGVCDGTYTVRLPAHAAVLVKVGKPGEGVIP